MYRLNSPLLASCKTQLTINKNGTRKLQASLENCKWAVKELISEIK